MNITTNYKIIISDSVSSPKLKSLVPYLDPLTLFEGKLRMEVCGYQEKNKT